MVAAPAHVAQQFPSALAPDWDSPLDALKDHLGQQARESARPSGGRLSAENREDR